MKSNSEVLVQAALSELGIQLAPAAKAEIVKDVEGRLAYDQENRRYFLKDGNGNRAVTADASGNVVDVSFHAYVSALIKRSPEAGSTSSGSSELNLTERMMAVKAAQKDDGKGRAAAEALKGNPWHEATHNLTRQYLIHNLDPDLAARLKAEAGVTP